MGGRNVPRFAVELLVLRVFVVSPPISIKTVVLPGGNFGNDAGLSLPQPSEEKSPEKTCSSHIVAGTARSVGILTSGQFNLLNLYSESLSPAEHFT